MTGRLAAAVAALLLSACVSRSDIPRDPWEAQRRMPSEPAPRVDCDAPLATPLDVIEGLDP